MKMTRMARVIAATSVTIYGACAGVVAAAPTMVDPKLGVRLFADGLDAPTGIAFIGSDDILALEKNTGRVVRITNGVNVGAVLDLSVNFFSERGLLGIALDPDFPEDPSVYLFWTCRTAEPPKDRFYPDERECSNDNLLGPDTEDTLSVPLLGNRVDRFRWDGSSLQFESNLIMLRAFQNDAADVPPDQGDQDQPARGNHDGGVIAFGPDEKLYILFGDVGRRGQLQNLPSGPTETGLGETVADDQFGGPEPDDAHLTGVILRLNKDGSAPGDNPFFEYGASLKGEVGRNIQKIFAYGFRNSFGMAFDPLSGSLWMQENGEDAFDELNLISSGMNSGWIQIMGPLERLDEYKEIETTSTHHEDFPNLQQFRWGPERIADSESEAISRLFVLPGSTYQDPKFSWKHVVAPAAIGFVNGRGLGPSFSGDLFVGLSVPEPLGGVLYHFNLTGNRRKIAVDDPALEDRVADNVTFHELTESEDLVIGTDFGVVTDIETGPNGNLFVVSLIDGAIYEIFGRAGGGPDEEDRSSASASSLGLTTLTPMSSTKGSFVEYRLPELSRVDLGIFDVLGQRIATLASGNQEAGSQRLWWSARREDGAPIVPGVYFVRLRTAGTETGSELASTKKLILTR